MIFRELTPITACPEDVALQTSTFSTDFTTGENTSWVADAGTTLTYSDLGAAFTINEEGEAPTIYTNFYIFFGYVEVKLRASSGVGIISSIVLESDDLDEIDWVRYTLWICALRTSTDISYRSGSAVITPLSKPIILARATRPHIIALSTTM
jgi:hypothetical protein